MTSLKLYCNEHVSTSCLSCGRKYPCEKIMAELQVGAGAHACQRLGDTMKREMHTCESWSERMNCCSCGMCRITLPPGAQEVSCRNEPTDIQVFTPLSSIMRCDDVFDLKSALLYIALCASDLPAGVHAICHDGCMYSSCSILYCLQ